MYQAGEKPPWRAVNAEVNARKRTDLTWLREIPWAVVNRSLADLGSAFTAFFRALRAGRRKPGYPRFKAKKRTRPAFAIEGRALRFDGKRVRIPKLGWVRTRQNLRFPGKIIAARFTKRAGYWYVSIQVEIDESRWSYPHRCETQATVGMDRGLRDLVVLSTGERFEAPRTLRRYEARLRRLNKELARRTRGGRNRAKTRAKLARLHERIANVRRDATHKVTADLVRRFRWIGIEDLNVAGMARSRFAKSVADAAMAEVVRQLAYKAPLAGSTLVVADRWYPSTKRCSVCGYVLDDLSLGARTWVCSSCQTRHDRDVNAAENLRLLAAAHAVTAQRQGSSDDSTRRGVKLPSGWEPGVQAVN
jgi:putative transposase